VEKWLGRGVAAVIALVVIVGLIVWSVRRRRGEAREERRDADSQTAERMAPEGDLKDS
jgi:heme exporter protein D